MTPICETLRPTTTPTPDTDKPSLEEALQDIRQDSQVRPDRYLDEVVVPFGGE